MDSLFFNFTTDLQIFYFNLRICGYLLFYSKGLINALI